MKIFITGASGYIGSRLTTLASSKGHEVILASRLPPFSSSNWFPYDLNNADSIILQEDIDVVIHLATDTTFENDNKTEILAAKVLIQATKKISAKFIYISSQTARHDAPTAYGRLKWKIEQDVLASDGWVIRPGQVYGGNEQGLFGMLVSIVRSLPILPAFLPSPKVQPIHVDDLSKGLLCIAQADNVASGVICIASPEPVSFTKFLSVISCQRVRKQKLFIPFPIIFITIISSLIGYRLRNRLGLERLKSLFDLPIMDTKKDLKILNLSLRSLSSGMHRSGSNRRRTLILEGRALFMYLLKSNPSSSLIRRYVRVIEKMREGKPLGLPQFICKQPLLIGFLDRPPYAQITENSEFVGRLDDAMVLAEATIQGASSFLGFDKKSGVFVSLFIILKSLISEAFWRVLSLTILPIMLLFKEKS
jgi:nucleoside-diphosphate-sugar epimerase